MLAILVPSTRNTFISLCCVISVASGSPVMLSNAVYHEVTGLWAPTPLRVGWPVQAGRGIQTANKFPFRLRDLVHLNMLGSAVFQVNK